MKEFLSQKGIPYIEKDVSVDHSAANEMVSKTGQTGVPVIILDEEAVVGFDRGRLESIIAVKMARKPSFGLKIADASSIAMKRGGLPVFGAYIGGVRTGSEADKMGLKEGDIITELNIQPIRNSRDLETAISRLGSGSRLQLVFSRGGNILKAETVL